MGSLDFFRPKAHQKRIPNYRMSETSVSIVA
jgi:hypothetical protein